MTADKARPGIGRRTAVAGACAVAAAWFAATQRRAMAEQLSVFDLPLVFDLVAVGDRVSVVASASGQYVHWNDRVLGVLPGPPCAEATIVRCARLAERSYVLELAL